MTPRLLTAACMAVALAFGAVDPAPAQMRGSSDVASARPLVSFDRLHPGTSAAAAVILSVEAGWHVNAREPGIEYLIPTDLELGPPPGIDISPVSYPDPQVRTFEFSPEPLRVYEGETALRFDLRAEPGAEPGPRRIEGTLTVQACSHNLCLQPARLPIAFDVVVAPLSEAVTPQHPEWFGEAPAAGGATSGAAGPPPGNPIARLIGRHGWWLALGAIFLAGLGLNLTPCVYPIIPITVSYFGTQAAERPLPRLALAAAYVLGLSLTYSALGVAAALTGGMLGATLQSPWTLATIAALMVALALSCFGVYEIRLPSALSARLGSRRGVAGALFMGMTIGIVAAPCVGPFVIPLLAYVGASGDPWQGFCMFMALSAGLGAPYVFLALGAASIAALPRAGEWMVAVKRIFGLALLAMAIYFATPLLPEPAEPWALPGFLLAAAAYLAFFERAAGQVRLFRAVQLLCAALALAAALALGWPAPPGIAWAPYSAAVVEEARAGGRPVVIDFSADWCLPCKELDRITFRDPRVVEAAAPFTALRADVTRFAAPEVEEVRKRYDVLGVPTVLFLNAAGEEVAEARVTGYVGASEFLGRLQRVSAIPASAGGAPPGPPPGPGSGSAPPADLHPPSSRRLPRPGSTAGGAAAASVPRLPAGAPAPGSPPPPAPR
jgi:thiol:disulfide interchange protein DsbD